VLNLLENRSFLSSKPSVAFDEESPFRVNTTRTLYRLSQVGVRFAPVPGFVIGIYDYIVESGFKPQRRVEGALFAYYVSQGDRNRAEIVARQSLNLFINKTIGLY